ncbi:MAG: hypothetical protein ACJAVK_002038 [Akkermansiaceae bacterium]
MIDLPFVEVITLWGEAEAGEEVCDFIFGGRTAWDETLRGEDSRAGGELEDALKFYGVGEKGILIL